MGLNPGELSGEWFYETFADRSNLKTVDLSFAFDWSPRTRPLDESHKVDELNWFKRVAKSRDGSGEVGNSQESGVSGKDLLNAMYNVSKDCHCIRTLTTAGHGGGAGSSLDYIESPKWKKDAGFYLHPTSRNNNGERFDEDSRSIEDLKNQIKWGGIKFCKPCLIQIHQCRSSQKLVQELSKATGCRVVAALGGAHGENYNDPNVWISDGAEWVESENGSLPRSIGNKYVPK